jgi:uncharacterized protein
MHVAALAAVLLLGAALPPKPDHYFSDGAGVVSAADADRLDARLRAFDQRTGHQILVALFRELPADAALEDFTARTAESWGVGRRQEDDGAVLFVFVANRRSRLEVGYGLEGQIPDIVAKHILQDVLAPPFREQRYAAGIEAALDAIFALADEGARGGTTRPVAGPGDAPRMGMLVVVVVLFLIVLFVMRRGGGSGGGWSRGGWTYYPSDDWSSSSGGSGGFGSGGGFEGGGGSFGGGGASGDW